METIENDDIKSFIRNGFVVFDRLLEKFKETFGHTFVLTGCPPVFGKVYQYNNLNFNCDMRYLNKEKTNSLLREAISKTIKDDTLKTGLASLKQGSEVNEYVLKAIRDASDNAFASFSAIEIKPREELSEEMFNAIMLLRSTNSPSTLANIGITDIDEYFDKLRHASDLVTKDPEVAWIRQIMIFTYKNLAINISFKSYYNRELDKLVLKNSKEEIYNSVVVGDIRNSEDGKQLSELYPIGELPFFIMDLDW